MSSPDFDRGAFEALANDRLNFRRSRRGTYMTASVARDWKWFQLGMIHAREQAKGHGITAATEKGGDRGTHD